MALCKQDKRHRHGDIPHLRDNVLPDSQPGPISIYSRLEPAALLTRPLQPSERSTHPEKEGLQVFRVSPLLQDTIQGLYVPGAALLVSPGDKTCRKTG